MEAITQESDSIVRPTQSFNSAASSSVKRPSLALWGAQLKFWQVVLKRTIDIIGALFGLVLLLPVGLIVALFIKLNSRGPLLYKQIRVGKGERRFAMLKFRSMYADADVLLKEILEADPELREEYARFHKLRNDPRITSVGRVIRKYSIDELPQLWNVLKGEMSLVGPRPYMPSELYKMRGRGARTILSVRPGLTGLWQTGGRNKLLFYERLELDVEYVEQWSLLLDVRLLWRTIPVILRGEGAS
jgi:lipopolysaccharide/colanic/teichoic acid biosynthesis glycosyltransferase